MTKDTALRKAIHVFEGLRRMMSVSENGLSPDKGCADTFAAIDETVQELKEMLRGLQGEQQAELKDWQREIMENGAPQRLVIKEGTMNKRETAIMSLETHINYGSVIGSKDVVMPMTEAENILSILKQEPVPAEIEGGGSNYWTVCGECHGVIDINDKYCRHCGGKVSWS